MLDEAKLIERLRRQEIHAFKQLVIHYSDDLLLLAYSLTGSNIRSSEIVGQVLLEVYNKAPTTDIPLPLKPYLQEEVRRACNDGNRS